MGELREAVRGHFAAALFLQIATLPYGATVSLIFSLRVLSIILQTDSKLLSMSRLENRNTYNPYCSSTLLLASSCDLPRSV